MWANVITLACLLSASYGFEVSPEEAGAVLVIVNLGMRAITEEPLAP